MSTIPSGKIDKLAADVAAYWDKDLGADFVLADGLTLTQFDAKPPLLQTARNELSDLNVAQRQKSDEVDGLENVIILAAVNLRKTVEVKYGKNSRQYLNAPKIPRYPAKKKTDTGGSGTT